jgi:hypothetical protein
MRYSFNKIRWGDIRINSSNIRMFRHLMEKIDSESLQINILTHCIQENFVEFARHLIFDLKIKFDFNNFYTLLLAPEMENMFLLLLEAEECGLLFIKKISWTKLFIDCYENRNYEMLEIFIRSEILNKDFMKTCLLEMDDNSEKLKNLLEKMGNK